MRQQVRLRLRLLWSVLIVVLCTVPVYADIDCDGVDDRVNTAQTMDNFITASTYTLMGWIKVQSTAPTVTTGGDMSPLIADTTGYMVLGRLEDTVFAASHFVDPVETLLTGSNSTGWYHLAQRLSGGTLTLFVNGVAVDSEGSVADLAEVVTGTLRMCRNPGTISLEDRVAQFGLYNVAVSDGEIENIAKSRLSWPSAARTAATGFWALSTCSDGVSANGVSFIDLSGVGNHLTGDDGANNTGLTCRASEMLRRPMWIQ